MPRAQRPLHDRLRGALIGLAVGDALGTTLEFEPPGTFAPISDMVGGGPFRLRPGEWTDDTSMALCMAESLVQTGGFDPVDQLARYLRWWRDGHLSSTGSCFDIGGQTRRALSEFESTGQPACGPTDDRSAGNGSLMRLAPVVIAFAFCPSEAVYRAGESSRTTHGALACVDGCRVFAAFLLRAFRGDTHRHLFARESTARKLLGEIEFLHDDVIHVLNGSYLDRSPPAIRGGGYVVDCLEAALWAVSTTDSFHDAVLAAAHLGDDADTTAAVAGQLAGAIYGESGIRKDWRDKLALKPTIDALADGLCELHDRMAESA